MFFFLVPFFDPQGQVKLRQSLIEQQRLQLLQTENQLRLQGVEDLWGRMGCFCLGCGISFLFLLFIYFSVHFLIQKTVFLIFLWCRVPKWGASLLFWYDVCSNWQEMERQAQRKEKVK